MIVAKRPAICDAARKHFEVLRWPNGPVCPKCGIVDQATRVQGKSHRKGMYQCNACREPFTVTVGSVTESSHVPLHKWALGFHLMASSKKGISAHQLMRNLGLGSYRTAWFLAHRIREAMREDAPGPIGGEGKTVEADETYIGRVKGVPVPPKGGTGHKHVVLTLVERGGSARSFHVDGVGVADLKSFIVGSVDPATNLMTDEHTPYRSIGKGFASHETVHHGSKEYVRGHVITNTVEGYFSVFQARPERRLSALRRAPFAPVPHRVRFPIFVSCQTRFQRHAARGAGDAGCRWQAAYLQTTSCSTIGTSARSVVSARFWL